MQRDRGRRDWSKSKRSRRRRSKAKGIVSDSFHEIAATLHPYALQECNSSSIDSISIYLSIDLSRFKFQLNIKLTEVEEVEDEEPNPNKSIIISGESGAGKTEATKILLWYFSDRTSSSSSGMFKQMLTYGRRIVEMVEL